MDHPDTDPLGSLLPEADPPRRLERRIARTLRARGLLRPRPSPTWQRAAAVAAAVAMLAVGCLIGAARRDAPAPAPALAGGRYVLFLYEDERFDTTRPEAELVREYTAWAAELRGRGRLVTGARLALPGLVLARGPDTVAAESASVASAAGVLTGLFVIRADSEAEALAIAGSCPHLSYGGTVAVRPIAGP